MTGRKITGIPVDSYGIRTLYRSQGKTQAEIGELTGYTRESIGRALKRGRMERLMLERIAWVLSITPDRLIAKEGKKNMNEIEVKNNQLIISEEMNKVFSEYQERKNQVEAFRVQLLDAMKKNGIKKFENEHVQIIYKEPSTSRRVNVHALKEDGMYEMYTTESKVSESVTIKFK